VAKPCSTGARTEEVEITVAGEQIHSPRGCLRPREAGVRVLLEPAEPDEMRSGHTWVDLPSAIRDRGSSIRDNSDRTARVYEKRNYSGRWVCVTRSGGSIHCHGYNLNDQTSSLKINRNDCG
jgi:hypothetical protein